MNGLRIEEGRIRDVSYVGMVTRFVVELDEGGELQVVRQNLEMSQEALEQRGRRVRVGWQAEHATRSRTRRKRSQRRTDSEIETVERVRRAHARAGRAHGGRGGGDDDDDGGGGGGGDESAALQKVGKGEGQVNLIAWAGYVEDGSTDPAVDWVSDFEKETAARST